jgi:VIT1/CCC1 family predicted Fe2+/Mn2+ transporter
MAVSGDAALTRRHATAKASVLGLFDGAGCFLGVVLGLLGHPALIVTAAIGVGAAETVSMAGGEWLSESDCGFLPSVAIGIATGAGAVLPALPYAFMPGWYARGWSIGLLVVLAALIAWRRRGERGLRRASAETFGILAAVALIVAVCVRFTPGAAA